MFQFVAVRFPKMVMCQKMFLRGQPDDIIRVFNQFRIDTSWLYVMVFAVLSVR